MVLGEVLLSIVLVVFCGAIYAANRPCAVLPKAEITVTVCLAVIISMLAIFSVRSIYFGTDTLNYSWAFGSYCKSSYINGFRYTSSHVVDFFLINLMMLGTCMPGLLTFAWPALITFVLLCMNGSISRKLYFIALLFISVVGLEMTTNALRQGISTAFIMVALSYWDRSKLISAAAATLAVATHSSAFLFIAVFFLASFSWRSFFLGFSAAIGLTLALLTMAKHINLLLAIANVSFLKSFLFEISHYLLLSGEELVRVLAMATVLGTIAAPWSVQRSLFEWESLLQKPGYNLALKLAMTCIPFAFVPYFGYRFIYGVYPAILWYTLSSVRPQTIERAFFYIFLANVTISLAWAFGSSHMRELPFF